MIPAPVTRSATTVPGSGIAVGGLTGAGVLYMFCQSSGCATSGGGTGAGIGAGDSTTGSTGTGSAMTGDGDATTGSRGTGSAMTGDGDATTGSTGTGSAMTGDGDATTGTGSLVRRGRGVVDDWLVLVEQALEKFPDPHADCAEAGGAAAR